MTADTARILLSRAVKRAWPNVTRASDLPFPEYWKAQMEWIAFHAPRIGERLAERFVEDMIATAQAAERDGREPEPWIVPEEVKKI